MQTNENRLLRGMIHDRAVWEIYNALGERSDLSPPGRIIERALGEYYGLDGAVQRCSDDVVSDWARRHCTNPKHAEVVDRTLGQLPADVSALNVIAELRQLRRGAIGERLALALANRAADNEVQALIEQYQTVPGVIEEKQTDLLDLFDTRTLLESESSPEHLIKLWPKELNDRVDGGVRRGHHILIFARPERGKTLFTINMCVGFLHQGLKVLYVGNEEPAEDLRMRFWMRLLKQPKSVIREQPRRAAEAIDKARLGELRIAPLGPGTIGEITKLVNDLKPDVVVLDQLRNLEVVNENRTGQLEAAASGARAIAKRFGVLVVSVTQAGDSATDKVYLALNDVDASKTGIPAAVDLMLGIGGSDVMQETGLLGVSLCKNKIGGNHDRFTVNCDLRTGVIS